MTNQYMFETGPIRPPSEASSLLLRVTRNCPWNKCKFCGVYKGEPFSTRSVEEIKADIDAMEHYRDILLEYKNIDGSPDYNKMIQTMNQASGEEYYFYFSVLNWLINGKGESVFLQDANSIVLKPERLAEVLKYLRKKFPQIKRVTSYGRADTLSKLSLEQLIALKNAGLDRIHSGYESGSDKVLALINKGCTKQQEIDGGLKAREAGIELSMYFMPGVGGRELSYENALETADVINKVNPDFVRLRTFVSKPETEMGKHVAEGEITPCTDEEKVIEIKQMIENISSAEGILVSDHIVNLLEEVSGKMDTDKAKMLSVIEEFRTLPYEKKREYQLARRMGMVRRVKDMESIERDDIARVKSICARVQDPIAWETIIGELLEKYI